MYNELKSKKNKLLIQKILKEITYETEENLFGTLWEIQNKINKIEDLLKEV